MSIGYNQLQSILLKMERSTLSSIPLLTRSNYLVWVIKMEAILSLKKPDKIIIQEKPEVDVNIIYINRSKDRMKNKE